MGLGAGSIIVNSRGQRFMHGGYTYNDFSHPFGFFDQRNPGLTNKGPAWCVFGAARGEGVMGGKVGYRSARWSDRRDSPRPEWLVTAPRPRARGEDGVDPDALEATVTRYNEYAEKGEDPDWGDSEQKYSRDGS